MIRRILTASTCAALLLAIAPASAKPIPVSSVTASASHTMDGFEFVPEYLTDDRLYTFWVAGGDGGGLSDNLTFRFDTTHTVTRIEIYNGCQVSQETFEARGRLAKVALKVGFGSDIVLDVEDLNGKQVVELPEPVSGTQIRMFLKGLHHGNSWDQITITEIRFLDDDPEEYLTGLSASASSELEGGDYSAANLVDGFVDSMWCEGVKGAGEEDTGERKKGGEAERGMLGMEAARTFTEEGGGTGEWFKVDLGSRKSVSKIGIVIGDAYDAQTFTQSSRPATLRVTFDGGGSETWNLEDSSDWQYLDLGGKSVSWIKFTIDGVTIGKRYNDTSVGEVRVWAD